MFYVHAYRWMYGTYGKCFYVYAFFHIFRKESESDSPWIHFVDPVGESTCPK